MEKITLSNVMKISNYLAKSKSSFFVNPFYLIENCYFEEKDGEILVGQPSAFRKNEFNLLHVPKSVKNGQGFTLLFDEEIERLKNLGLKIVKKSELGIEYFYKTSDYLNLEGHEFSKIRKNINNLNKKYQVKMFNSYNMAKTADFIKKWSGLKDTAAMAKKELDSFNHEVKTNIDALNLLEAVPNKSYFVEIDSELAGFRITTKISDDLWVGIFKKVTHSFKGLDEYIYQVSASDYQGIPWFSTGPASGSYGLSEHKRSKHPKNEEMLYFVLTEKT